MAVAFACDGAALLASHAERGWPLRLSVMARCFLLCAESETAVARVCDEFHSVCGGKSRLNAPMVAGVFSALHKVRGRRRAREMEA